MITQMSNFLNFHFGQQNWPVQNERSNHNLVLGILLITCALQAAESHTKYFSYVILPRYNM